MRKTWMKPKLVVLVKGTADERVLIGCKGPYPNNAKGDTVQQGCVKNGDFCGACDSLVNGTHV
jgi:hypothetical protein